MKSLGGHTSSAVQHFIYLTLMLVSALFCLIVFFAVGIQRLSCAKFSWNFFLSHTCYGNKD